MDRCSLNEGYTPLILSMRTEKEEISSYIIQMAIVREKIRQEQKLPQELRSQFVPLDVFLNFRDKKSGSGLLAAAKSGFYTSFKQLFDLGANFYMTTAKMNNVQHNAVRSENDELVKFISWTDAENSSGYYLHH